MILPMMKYAFLVYEKEYTEFLLKLREAGVAHIIEKNHTDSEKIRQQMQQINQLNQVIRYLEKRNEKKTDASLNETTQNGAVVFEEMVRLMSFQDEIQKHQNLLKKELSDIEPWGQYDPELAKKLKNKSINIRFFICQKQKFDKEWHSKYDIFEVNLHAGLIYFVLVQKNDEVVEIDAEEVFPGTKSIHKVKDELSLLEEQHQNIEKQFDQYASSALPALEYFKKTLIEHIEFDKAIDSGDPQVEGKVKLIEAWCPKDNVIQLELNLSQSDVVFLKSEPQPDDKVPIVLKNKKFNRDFEVIGEMYSLPKYGELDLTPFFAPFYALFFGFCLGDVGYGLILSTIALLAKRKVKKEFKPVMNLLFYLGSATILFGLIGGTFFGINLYQTQLPVYSSLNIYLEANNTNINTVLFYLSLLIGAVHIIFGLTIKAVNETKQLGWKLAVGTYGWLTLLIGMITVFLAGKFTQADPNVLNIIQKGVLIISGIMILLLNNLKRKVYINIGIGIWDSYNMITGILGDLLSYIRLFALGISSAILGFVFNSLAVSMSGSIPVVSIIIMVIILLIGHSINLFMSGLGAFVHPMRLTFVEFYKNSGFSGGGKKYKPLKKIT